MKCLMDPVVSIAESKAAKMLDVSVISSEFVPNAIANIASQYEPYGRSSCT